MMRRFLPAGASEFFEHGYEDALDLFGRGRFDDFLAAAASTHKQIQNWPSAQELDDRMATLTLDWLEPQLNDLAMRTGPGKLWTGETLGLIEQTQKWIRAANQWKAVPRWQQLHASITDLAESATDTLINEARQLAADGKLDEASARLAELGAIDAGEKSNLAKKQLADWKREIFLRESAEERLAHLQRVKKLVDARQVSEAAVEIGRFLERYPASPESAEIARIKSQVQDELNRFYASLKRDAEKYWQEHDWTHFRETVRQFETLPWSDESGVDVKELTVRLGQLKTRAAGLFQQAEGLTVADDASTLKLVRLIREVLGMDPEHESARGLLEKHRKQAAGRAERHLATATRYENRKNRSEALRAARMAASLDPDGPTGDIAVQAQQIIARFR